MAEQLQNQYRPDVISVPGETLEELLEERGMSQAELAERTGRPKKTINEIIQGKATITVETALQLERVLGVPASFWLAREQQYREWLARQNDDQQLAAQVEWLHEVPVKAMVNAGWITGYGDDVEQLREVLRYFGIASPTQSELTTAVFRRPRAFQSDTRALAAWLRRGELLAQEIACEPYNEAAFRDALEQVRRLTREPFSAIEVILRRLCAGAGVAVVIVPELPHTCVCGATRWLSPTKALIQLSLRYRTDDQFWFSFFHEAGHILLHGKRLTFVDEEHDAEDNREAEANRFAMDYLIPPLAFKRLVQRRGGGYFSKELVAQFAEEFGIAPGIVVGRLQHEKLLQRTHLNGLKRSIEQ